ncbi:MAG TPA: glycosyltransferase family 4 protein [Xanthobacteraceae bacterium]|nr:glycosyltransferase family 4 protein [Xanthobacteraceae bacterium]
MRIGLVSSAVPLIQGGGRFIVDWLAPKLIEAGHQVETIWIPQTDDPETLFQQMLAFRLIDLNDSCDRIITFRPPAHVIPHHNKIVWFIHHFRAFYDLWQTEYCAVPNTEYWKSFRRTLMAADTKALNEARKVYTNSAVVGRRLKQFNGIDSEVLYPPVMQPERYFSVGYSDSVVMICRFEHHKRQHLAVEAMKYVKTPVRLHIAGMSSGEEEKYVHLLRKTVMQHRLANRVTLDYRWISESEKISLLSSALAAAYVPLDEDSYGYPTVEAALASKCTITTSDAGGVREFVSDGVCGVITAADPRSLAEAFDRLWSNRKHAGELGSGARARVDELKISWADVVRRLTG